MKCIIERNCEPDYKLMLEEACDELLESIEKGPIVDESLIDEANKYTQE